ncbi:MAG: DUF4168 domain-containing protein [Cyclonatronaceae bacterium]
MKSQSIAIGIIAAVFAFFAVPAQAQFEMPEQEAPPEIEISDEELELFIDASMNAQSVQAESQQEMITIVDEEGIEVSTYNEIIQAQQMGQSMEDIEVSAEDLEKFERANEQIQEIEEQMERQLSEAVEEEGMEMERFQEINMAIQQDPSLQQRVQQMIQETQMQQQQQQPQQPEGY